jgi:hypothetical protein
LTHPHAFVRETKLTEKEFQDAIGYVNAIGQQTTPSHNEAMLLSGSLGVEPCLPDEQRRERHAPDAGQQPRAVLPRRRAGAPMAPLLAPRRQGRNCSSKAS